MIEKSLRQSRPEFQPPAEDKAPEIIIQDSRTLEDPGAGPAFFVRRVLIEGNTLIDSETLGAVADVGEGMQMTLGILSLMANEITAMYASQGYLLTRAFVPQQEVKDGTVKIIVAEGHIGKIEVKGAEHNEPDDFKQWMIPVREETVLREQTLEQTLLELNDLLGVQARSVLRPGDLPGTSDLVLEVTETRPYTVSFDADNFGSRFTGRNRFGLSGTVGNLVRLGDQFSIRWVRSDFGQDFYNPVYTVPLNSRGTRFKVSYTFSEHELGANLSALAAGGSSAIWGLELSQLLRRTRTSQVQARGGIEFKSYENEQLGVNTSKDTPTEIYAGLAGNFSDEYLGRNFYDTSLHLGLKEGDTSRGLISRSKGQGDVLTWNWNLTRYQAGKVLNGYFIMKFNGQVNNLRALSPGLMSIGGMGTVRGFPLSEHSGDQGYLMSVEWVVPWPDKTHLAEWLPTLDQVLSFNTFIDHGRVFVREKATGEVDRAITGAGMGFKVNIPKKEGLSPAVSFALTYGIPVLGSPDPSDQSYGIVYLSGLINY